MIGSGSEIRLHWAGNKPRLAIICAMLCYVSGRQSDCRLDAQGERSSRLCLIDKAAKLISQQNRIVEIARVSRENREHAQIEARSHLEP